MENCSALSIIKQMPENKAQINSFVRSVKEEILKGYSNPLELDIRLKILEEVIKNIRKDELIQDAVITEAEKYPEKTVTLFGCEIQKRSNSTYNYKYCNDSVLEQLQSDAEEANKKLKERQELLKMIKPGQLCNPDTGEMIEPPLVSIKTVLAIKIL